MRNFFLALMILLSITGKSQKKAKPTTIHNFATFLTKASMVSGKEILFNHVHIQDTIDFGNASSVTQMLKIKSSRFDQSASLKGVTYGDSVIISNMTFSTDLFFLKSNFGPSLSITDVVFERQFAIRHSVLPQIIKMNRVSFPTNMTLDFSTNAVEGDKCLAQFQETDISQIVLPYELFRFDFDEKNLEGNSYTHAQKARIYELLIRNSKEAGFVTSAEKWDIDYKKYMNEKEYGGVGNVFNFISENYWNFGYSKSTIFWVWTPVFFLLFFIINYFSIFWAIDLYHIKEIGEDINDTDETNLEDIIKQNRVRYALIYTGIIYFGLKIDPKGIDVSKGWGIVYPIIVYLIGTINILGCAGYLFK